jgi:hypothetical protein
MKSSRARGADTLTIQATITKGHDGSAFSTWTLIVLPISMRFTARSTVVGSPEVICSKVSQEKGPRLEARPFSAS